MIVVNDSGIYIDNGKGRLHHVGRSQRNDQQGRAGCYMREEQLCQVFSSCRLHKCFVRMRSQAQPTVPNPRVTVSGQPTVLLTSPYVISGCTLPPPTAADGPCVSAQWLSGTTRVTSNGQPLLVKQPGHLRADWHATDDRRHPDPCERHLRVT
jgi:hypothetical protein